MMQAMKMRIGEKRGKKKLTYPLERGGKCAVGKIKFPKKVGLSGERRKPTKKRKGRKKEKQ